jgi:hypothetical protein
MRTIVKAAIKDNALQLPPFESDDGVQLSYTDERGNLCGGYCAVNEIRVDDTAAAIIVDCSAKALDALLAIKDTVALDAKTADAPECKAVGVTAKQWADAVTYRGKAPVEVIGTEGRIA